MLLNCKMLPNARTTSPDGCSECGYTTRATSDTCTSFKKTLNQNLLYFVCSQSLQINEHFKNF